MSGENALRQFLSSRRAAISPQQTGLPSSPSARRVPGLRREEVAALAGVSVAYYTKLEQGPRPPADVKARPALIAMIYALDPVPALIHGPRLDVLAANDAAKLLIDDFGAMPAKDRNLAPLDIPQPARKGRDSSKSA